MTNKTILLSAAAAATLILSGCGGGSTPASPINSDDVDTTVTGTFIDAAVEGLSYACAPSGLADVTNEQGEYTCNIGDTVTFKVGAITLGSTTASSGEVTPYTLFPTNTEAAINVAQLLQSLDDDGSYSSTIVSLPLN